mmetsp:Transcript_67060/g.178607  ORF Transcript_67060/g.178607 Transcript_67060/m.178607 type:complete len:287 (-) Transcript_67060:291-1151(-)
MPKRDAHVSQNGGVGEVPLQSAHRKLLREVLEDRIGHAQVALGILKVDRVDLVRHGAGPDLPCHDLLLEVLHRNIHPDVAAQVDEDGVDALHRVKDGTHVVVVLNLRGVLLPLEIQVRPAEVVGKGPPVDVRVGHEVRVHVAGGPPKLARARNLPQEIELRLEALDVHLELLGEVGRGGRLPVRLREHGHIPLWQLCPQRLDDPQQSGAVALLEGVVQELRRRGVVDVLTGKRKVNVLLERLQTQGIELLLDEVLHSFDVVIGDLLRCLDLGGVINAQVSSDRPQL